MALPSAAAALPPLCSLTWAALACCFISSACAGFYAGVCCPRRASHGQTRGDLYSCSAACHLLLCGLYHLQSEPTLGGRRVKTSHALSPPGASRPNPRRPVLLFCGLSPSALRLVTTLPIRARASLAALGSKPRVRCPRRAPHGKNRGDLYSCSVAVSPPQEVQPVIDASSTTRWHSSSWPRQVRLF